MRSISASVAEISDFIFSDGQSAYSVGSRSPRPLDDGTGDPSPIYERLLKIKGIYFSFFHFIKNQLSIRALDAVATEYCARSLSIFGPPIYELGATD